MKVFIFPKETDGGGKANRTEHWCKKTNQRRNPRAWNQMTLFGGRDITGEREAGEWTT